MPYFALRALIHLDRPHEAVAFYQNCCLTLNRELGVEPGGRLRGLAASIECRS